MHVAAVIGSTASYFYLNGILKNSPGGIGAGTTTNTAGRFVQIAKSSGTGGTAADFNGSIDEVRIHNRALSGAEVMRLYSDRTGGMGLVKPRGRFAQAPSLMTWLPRALRWGR